MRFVVKKADFEKALKLANAALMNKIHKEYNAIRIDVCNTRQGTSYMAVAGINASANITIRTDLVSHDGTCKICIDPTRIIPAVSSMQGEFCEMELQEETRMLTIRNDDWVIRTSLADFLPARRKPITPGAKTQVFVADAEKLAYGIEKTAHARNKGDIMLSSCFFIEILEDKQVRVKTMDGTRISVHGPKGEAQGSILVQGYLLEQVAKYLKGDVKITVSGTRFEMATKDILLSGDLPATEYYNISKYTSRARARAQTVTMSKTALANAIAATGCFSDNALFTTEGAYMRVVSNDTISETKYNVAIRGNGPVTTFRLFLRPLREALAAIADEEIRFSYTDAITPVFIEGDTYVELLAPAMLMYNTKQ